MHIKTASSLLALSVFGLGLRSASAADISGTITLNGTPPAEVTNNENMADQYKDTCGKVMTGPVTTHFYVVGPNKGLRDVVVYLVGIKGKSTGATAPPVILDQKACEYHPYIFAVQTGQQIVVRNSDAWPHNVHIVPNSPGNDEQNFLENAGEPDKVITFQSPADFITFKCDIHDWMRSWVTVVDHPWFAVTDDKGAYKISNVPPGKYTVQALHRKASGGKPVTQDVEVKDATVTLDFSLDAPK